MIEPRDLRIGNFVNVKRFGVDIPATIESGKDIDENIDLISAIPLTEEWLIKWGLEKINKNEFSLEIDNGLSILHQSCNYIYLKYNEIECEVSMIEYKYVNQLQNLYFALTGKELEVKGES